MFTADFKARQNLFNISVYPLLILLVLMFELQEGFAIDPGGTSFTADVLDFPCRLYRVYPSKQTGGSDFLSQIGTFLSLMDEDLDRTFSLNLVFSQERTCDHLTSQPRYPGLLISSGDASCPFSDSGFLVEDFHVAVSDLHGLQISSWFPEIEYGNTDWNGDGGIKKLKLFFDEFLGATILAFFTPSQ
jgi:hypothetical protein